MTIRKWVYLFFTTLLVGGLFGTVTGLFINWSKLSEGSFLNTFFGGLVLLGLACTFSIISQMGFFAYLSIHRFGLGLFKSQALWSGVQLVLIAFTLFDLFYLRHEDGAAVLPYLIIPIVLLIAGVITGYFKKVATNHSAFVPTIFFMVVVTTLELIPVLRTEDPAWIWPVMITLLACNAWQVMILHKLVSNKQQRG